MKKPDNRVNHGPLTVQEQSELSEALSELPPLYQQAISAGVTCLPDYLRARAKLDWCRRWEQD